jgi:PKD repeat protein
VKVYAKSAKSRTFQLQNNSGSVLATKTLSVPAGSSRVILNFNIPAENNLRLVGPSSPDLYRNNAGTNYPYQIGNKIVIKSSSATQDPTGYYYFFYDWEVQGETCRSNRLPLNVYINSAKPTPSFSYISNGLNVSFTNATLQGVNYLWEFGDGSTSILTNPTHTYGVYGNFDVKLTATNACGIDTIAKTINVEVSVNENNTLNNLNIYPNPTNSLLYIHFPSSISGKLQMQLLTMTGQLIWNSDFESSTNELNTTIDMSKFAKGIYYLKVKQQNQLIVKKVIKL